MRQAACPQPIKFYIDCGQEITASAANEFCQVHKITLVNLNN